jgi:hypothetical protein
MPVWNLRIPMHVVRVMQCSSLFPIVHDVYFLWHDWENHGGVHGQFYCLWQNFHRLFQEFRHSLTIVRRKTLSLELGEMPFYGSGRNSAKAQSVCSWDRGGQSKKIEVIEQLPPPTNVKGICSFLGHVGFYRWFIKDFSQIMRPLTSLLAKDAPFIFNDECLEAFQILKKALISAPIIQPPD